MCDSVVALDSLVLETSRDFYFGAWLFVTVQHGGLKQFLEHGGLKQSLQKY